MNSVVVSLAAFGDRQGKKIALLIIKIGKELFYDTPVHRLKIVNIVFEWLFHAAYKQDTVLEVPYEGSVFKIPARDITLLPSILNDNYEKYEIALFRKLLKPGDTLVDVGANIGLFSVIGAKSIGASGKVYSFEPEPGNYSLLSENLIANGVANVRAENLAVGDKKGTLSLYIERNSIGSHSLLKRSDETLEGEIEVDVVKLDDYFIKSPEEIKVMKVDVEGYEPYVLKGSANLLKKVQCLFFEYSRAEVETNYGIQEMVALLESFNYIYRINERTRTLHEFSANDFKTTRYVNILATKKKIE